MDLNEEVKKRWDDFAEDMGRAYTTEGDLNRIYLLNPAILQLVGQLKGKHVLDAVCGEGYLSRKMFADGAKVKAFDFSSRMVEVAKQKSKGFNIPILQGDFQDLSMIKDNEFDIVISNMVIHDLPYHNLAIGEAYRVLKPGGIFVFSILHPCFDTPESGWVKDSNGNKLYWKVSKYFTEGIVRQETSNGSILMFHRTLSNYFKTLRQCGFVIDDLIEPEPTDEAIEAHNDYMNFKNMCHFIVIKAVK
ncbi:class I SAM-dependent methyltransferase [Paenibacillus sp. FSL W7-1287]|uniref:class I SAM-dependent methyltransferase n=1 Tax=Paenibacillus sp. FSL W7-1287 TaxID=2954538 RepID=UPI0030F9AF5B